MQHTPHLRHPIRISMVILTLLTLLLLPVSAHAGKEPKKTVAVTAFENRAFDKAMAYKKQHQLEDFDFGNLGQAMAQKLMEALIDTGKFVVLDRLALNDVLGEQNLEGVAPVNPKLQARLTSAQALIRGVVTDIEIIGADDSDINLMGVGLKFKSTRVRIKVNLRIIDTTTGQVIESKSVEGIAKKRGGGLRLNRGDLKTNISGSRNLPLGKAADKAVTEAVGRIVAGMAQIPWQGRVARVSGEQIFINAGRQENVEPGLQLRVFQEGARLIDPETNEDLGTLDEEIGVVEVDQVGDRFAVAKVVAGRGFARGNVVRPALE